MADDNPESREQSGSASETENRANPGSENGSTQSYDSPLEVWEDPPEWMENIQEDGGEIIPLGAGSRSIQHSYISIRTSGSIGISQKAMYKYFNESEGVALAVQSPKGGGSKKLYMRPIDDIDNFPLGNEINQKESGSGNVNVGTILDDYNLIPDESTKYKLDWNDEIGAAVVNFRQNPELD